MQPYKTQSSCLLLYNLIRPDHLVFLLNHTRPDHLVFCSITLQHPIIFFSYSTIQDVPDHLVSYSILYKTRSSCFLINLTRPNQACLLFHNLIQDLIISYLNQTYKTRSSCHLFNLMTQSSCLLLNLIQDPIISYSTFKTQSSCLLFNLIPYKTRSSCLLLNLIQDPIILSLYSTLYKTRLSRILINLTRPDHLVS